MVKDGDEGSQKQTKCGFHYSIVRLFGCICGLMVLLIYYLEPSELAGTWTSTMAYFFPEKYQVTNASLTTAYVKTSAEPWKPLEPYYVKYPHKYTFLINEPQKCQNENIFVLLMVPVSPNNMKDRDIIRSTWGQDNIVENKLVRLLFLVGLPASQERETLQEILQQESDRFHDLLQSDFLDSYNNLTVKTMVMLEWLAAHCLDASYAMKVDSDIFLNVKNLVKMLLNAPKQNYMTGLVARSGRVLRDPRSKWYLPKSVFSPAIYPPYALGLGYVFSLDLSFKLVVAAQHVKPVYIEDVFLGICMKYLGISPTDPPRGDLFNIYPVKYNRCQYSKLIATTTKSMNDLVEFWTDLQKPDPPCY